MGVALGYANSVYNTVSNWFNSRSENTNDNTEHDTNTETGAKSSEEHQTHIEKHEAAKQKLKELEETLSKTKGPKKQAPIKNKSKNLKKTLKDMKKKYDKNGEKPKTSNGKIIWLNNWQNSEEELLNYFYQLTVKDIYIFLKSLSRRRKEELFHKIEKILSRELIISEVKRISIIKLIVALLPEAFSFVERILGHFHNKYDFELQFTLFCYIEWTLELYNNKFKTQISELLKIYLMNVPKETAYATWMLGELLYNHWPRVESLAIVLYCGKNARYIAGRKVCVKVLSKFLHDKKKQQNVSITHLLQDLKLNDNSSEIRYLAKLALDGKLTGTY